MLADPTSTVVFTGAGLSKPNPAGLPLGWTLRDIVLDACFEEATAVAPGVATPAQLHAVKSPPDERDQIKLEVVVGRAAATVGRAAIDALAALHIELPNEAHMLAALALAQGGYHITVNFDEGIERAYALLTGQAALPAHTPAALTGALPDWQQAMPPSAPRTLRVVATRREFDDWVTSRSPAALLKIHGSVRAIAGAVDLADPVVQDELQYQGLTESRDAALEELRHATTIVISGYSGLDIDVYDPLFDRLAAIDPATTTLVLWASPEVADSVRKRMTALPQGRVLDKTDPTHGYAVETLRSLFGWSSLPSWPQVPPPSTFDDRINDWRKRFRRDAEPGARAEAYAWLLADLGRYDDAFAIISELDRLQPHRLIRRDNRAADILYDRNGPKDRSLAARRWRRIAVSRAAPADLRAYAWTRLGEIGRGAAMRGSPPRRLAGAVAAVVGPAVALLLCRNGRRHPEQAARALSAWASFGLRLLESVPPAMLLRLRPLFSLVAAWAHRSGERAMRLQPGGNRLLFARQQQAEVALFDALMRRAAAPAAAVHEIEAIKARYERAPDQRGVANTTAALALASIVNGDESEARKRLNEAEARYASSRPSQAPDPSGIALVNRRRRLAEKLGLRVG